jgi:hypothetical protein
MNSTDDPIVAFAKQLLPSVVVEPDEKPQPGIVGLSYHILLPVPAGADYGFILWLGAGEKQISARLLTADERSYFWYMPFEEPDYRSADQLTEAFLSTTEKIIRHNTRIEQKRGLLFTHFKCEFESPMGWRKVYGHSGLRWIGGPRIKGNTHIYQSPKLVS